MENVCCSKRAIKGRFNSNLGLVNGIVSVLNTSSEKPLLCDASHTLTGRDIERIMTPLIETVERYTTKGSRIGIVYPDSAIQALLILMVMRSGRVPVVLDSTMSDEVLSRFIPKTKLHMLIINTESSVEILFNGSVISVDESGSISRVQTCTQPEVPSLPQQGTALILYTSGSLGEPKGVQLTETGLLFTFDHLIKYFKLNEKTVSLINLPLFHTMALNTHFLPTFFAGGKSYFINPKFEIQKTYRKIAETGATFTSFIGEFLRLCIEEKKKRCLPPIMHVKHIQMAGGHILPQHVQWARELFPCARIHKGYGLTEAIRVAMMNDLDCGFRTQASGYALPGVVIEIKDDQGSVVPPGQLGRIFVKGPSVMMGYDGEPSASENEALSTRGLDTGDLGKLSRSGLLTVVGRVDGIYKNQGRRVSLKEIEKAALNTTPGVRDAKCIVVPSKKRGLKPVLFLEMKTKSAQFILTGEKDRFEKKLKSKVVESYKFPRDVFVLDRFPRTATGKVKGSALHAFWSLMEHAKPVAKGSLGCRYYMEQPAHSIAFAGSS